MVFLAITRSGFEASTAFLDKDSPLWACAEVLSKQELAAVRLGGVDDLTFNSAFEPHEAAVI